LAVSVVLAACGSDEADRTGTASATSAAPASTTVPEVGPPLPVAVQELEIAGDEYLFDLGTADPELHAGWTRVTFDNVGEEAHQVMFASLKEGVDLAQLAEVAGEDSSGSRAIEFVDMLGGVSYIGPGQSIEALVDLPEGVVMAMCYVPDPEGVAHALSGMSTMLNVGPAAEAGGTGPTTSGPESADPTTADERVVGTITMGEDGYVFPEAMPTGWYRVVNEDGGERAGEGLHELSILGLETSLSDGQLTDLLDDLAGNQQPAVSLEALGGMGALSAGFEGYLWLDLAPGSYLAVDFMPDPGDPRPHLLDGYVTAFDL